jgi:hypothetical protein
MSDYKGVQRPVCALAALTLGVVLLACFLSTSNPAVSVTAAPLSSTTALRGPISGLSPCGLAVYYGQLDASTVEQLKDFDLVVLHPQHGSVTRTQVAALQAAGVIVLGYVSIGEEPPLAGITPISGDGLGPVYFSSGVSCTGVISRQCGNAGVSSHYLDEDGHDGVPDVNGAWGSYYVDSASPVWRDRVKTCNMVTDASCSFYGTDYVLNTLGCDGVFLDTVDTASPWHVYAYTLDSMAEAVCGVADQYPDKYVVLNRGIFYADAVYGADTIRPCINGIVFESYYSEWNWGEGKGKISPWFSDNRDVWAPKLDEQANLPDGYTVFALDYFAATQPLSIAAQITETVQRWGWIDYVSTPMLDTVRRDVWQYCHQPMTVSLPIVLRDYPASQVAVRDLWYVDGDLSVVDIPDLDKVTSQPSRDQ